MSVRQGLLALLARGEMYGYQLKSAFEASTGQVWPLNIGQVYSTLARLERDGLVELVRDDGDQRVYAITDAGRIDLDRWFSSPVAREAPPRDELAVKLMLAWQTDGIDVAAVIQAQRTATVESLQDYTRLKADSDSDHDLLWVLMLDQLILHAEAEVRWLDACEARLRRSGAPTSPLQARRTFLTELTNAEVRR